MNQQTLLLLFSCNNSNLLNSKNICRLLPFFSSATVSYFACNTLFLTASNNKIITTRLYYLILFNFFLPAIIPKNSSKKTMYRNITTDVFEWHDNNRENWKCFHFFKAISWKNRVNSNVAKVFFGAKLWVDVTSVYFLSRYYRCTVYDTRICLRDRG